MMSRWLTPKKFVSFAARLRFCSNVDISGGGVVMLVMLYSERSEVMDGQSGSERLRLLGEAASEAEVDGMSGSLGLWSLSSMLFAPPLSLSLSAWRMS